jgi:hypothetical protein
MRLSIQVPSIYPEAMEALYDSWVEEDLPAFSDLHYAPQGYLLKLAGAASHPFSKLNYPSMFMLRSFLWERSPVANYYLMTDDNAIFKPGIKKYLEQCLDWMDDHPEAGFMSLAGFFGSYAKKDGMHFSNAKIWNINLGLIVRGNIQPFPEGAKVLTGGLEDVVTCYWVLEQGYLPAKRFLAPVKHIGLPAKERLKGSSWIHDWDVWDKNAMELIRHRYKDPTWSMPLSRDERPRFPKLIKAIMKGKLR